MSEDHPAIELHPRDQVQSLERGLAVIQAFDAQNPRLTLSRVAAITGLSRATARRLLLTLANLGFVGTDGKEFWLQSRILNLGYRFLTSQPWWHAAQSVLEDLTREVGETSSICVLEDDEIVYVSRVVATRIIATNLSIGSRLPSYPTALGRALLAQLPDAELDTVLERIELVKYTEHTVTSKAKLRRIIETVRIQGYATIDQELAPGLLGLAIPLQVRRGTANAALGLSLQLGRVPMAELVERYLPVLHRSATRIVTMNERSTGRGPNRDL